MAGRRLGDAADGPVCGRGEALSAANADAEEGEAEESGSTAREALSRGGAVGLIWARTGLDLGRGQLVQSPLGAGVCSACGRG
jgi:hypothetical protein